MAQFYADENFQYAVVECLRTLYQNAPLCCVSPTRKRGIRLQTLAYASGLCSEIVAGMGADGTDNIHLPQIPASVVII